MIMHLCMEDSGLPDEDIHFTGHYFILPLKRLRLGFLGHLSPRSFGKDLGPRLTAPPVLPYCIHHISPRLTEFCFKTPFKLIPAIEPQNPKIKWFVCRPRWGIASRNVPTDYSYWSSLLNAIINHRVMTPVLVPFRPGNLGWIRRDIATPNRLLAMMFCLHTWAVQRFPFVSRMYFHD